MANIFVTGGNGFIGSHFVAQAKKTNRVVALVRDILPSPWAKWLSEALEGCTIVRGDLLDAELIRRAIADYSVDSVVHLAAQAIVKVAFKDPKTTFTVNVLGTLNVLETCRQMDVEQILIQSTDKVYGDDRMNARETEPLGRTMGIYEQSKVAQDAVTRAYLDTYGLHIKITRPCNTYGYDLAPRIIPNTIKSCMRGDPPVIFEGQEKTVRQYIYVDDLVDALQLLMKRTQLEGIFNIGTDDILTQEEVVRKICNYFPLTPRVLKRDKPIKEIQKQSVNWNTLKSLGWTPTFTFETGIQETIKKFSQYGY